MPWALPVALTAVVLLAASARILAITSNPPGFFADEASAGYNAYSILKHGTDEHGEGWPLLFEAFGEYKLPVYIYSMVPFVAALGLTELAVRLTSALYGTLAVLAVFLLAAELFRHRPAGLAAAFFLAITPWHIHYSRTGFGELVSFPTVLTLGVWLFMLSLRREKLWPLAGLVLGMTLYTYRAAWIALPLLFLVLVALYWRTLLAHWRWALPGLAIPVLVGVPILLHLLSVSGDRSLHVSILELNLGAWETVKRFALHYQPYFSGPFLFQEGDNDSILRHYLPGSGHLLYLQFPFLVVGVLASVLSPTREKVVALALLALYPLPGAITDVSPISTRTILGPVTFALLSGYGLVVLADSLGKLNAPYGRAAVAALLVGFLVAAVVSFASYVERYHGQYPELSAGYWGWQEGPEMIVETFVSLHDDYDQLIMDGEFNAPYMFFRFYAPDGCGKCVAGGTGYYDPGKRQLFALKPKNIPLGYAYRTVDRMEYPGGETAFLLVEITGERGLSTAQ